MFIKFFSKLFVSLLLLGYSSIVIAMERAPKDITCLTTHYPPYTIYNENTGAFTGIDMQYLNGIADKLNWKLKVFNFPWGRLKREIQKSEYNCFFSLSYQPHRAKFLHYTSQPLHVTEYGVFFKKNREYIEQQNMANRIVGVMRGIPLTAHALRHHQLSKARFVYLDSNETLISILNTDRVDATVLNYEVGHYLLKETSFSSNIDSFKVAEYKLPVYLAFRKGTQNIKVIDAALQQVTDEINQTTMKIAE